MSIAFFDHSHEFVADKPGLAERIVGWISHYRKVRADARERRQIYAQVRAELSQLSDAELLDLNLSRAEIEDIAREAGYAGGQA